jgi:S1-C subfamily serine protease
MRIWVSGTWRSDEKASIVVKNLHSDVIVYAYEVNKWAAWNGSQSAAEACAKHMKNSIVRLSPEELAQFSASPRAKADESTTLRDGGSSVSIPDLGVFAGIGADGGVEITEVARHGLAEASGLHKGDVINSVDGKDVETPTELASEVAKRMAGSQIRVIYTFHTSALGDLRKEVVMIVRDRPKQN